MPMGVPVAKYLNGGRVAILKSDVLYAHFCVGILYEYVRTIAAVVGRCESDSPQSESRSYSLLAREPVIWP